ncbi:MAG: 2-oxo acid dehydrogenase subunit E2 [Acidobacteriota bacterium]
MNLGLAVDVAGKDGARSLKVPSVKAAEKMNFAQFVAAYDDLVKRARDNKLTVADFEGTTISLTNPGTVGTVGSIPTADAGPRGDHRYPAPSTIRLSTEAFRKTRARPWASAR